MTTNFCPQCGTQLKAGAKFCGACGQAVDPAVATYASNTSNTPPVEDLSLFEFFAKCIKNYANFRGRARRKEYWGFVLFNMIFMFVIQIFAGILVVAVESTFPTILYQIYILFVALPNFAVMVRRFHDTGRSGWNWLWALTIIGIIVIFVWLCTKGNSGSNKYGPDPKGRL